MSSPKVAAAKSSRRPRTTARPAAKLVVKAAKPALKVAKSDDKPATGISADAMRVAAEMERGIVDGKLDVVSTQALQSMMAIACRVYAARTEAGEQFLPLAKNSISATDVMVTASGLLKATDLAVFELGMWQSWTGR
jgi:hypothetical protein